MLDPPADGQMPILDEEFGSWSRLVRADPGWRAAMARRGLTDVSQIQACPRPRGRSGRPEDDRRRMVRVLAFVQAREHDLAWAHPVDGVAAYVDLIEKKVFKITDEFDLAVPAESGDYDDEAVRGPQRTTLRPIEITQPEGPSFILNGTWLQWNWSVRIGFDAREGLTLQNLVEALEDPGVLGRVALEDRALPCVEQLAADTVKVGVQEVAYVIQQIGWNRQHRGSLSRLCRRSPNSHCPAAAASAIDRMLPCSA